MRTVLVTGPTGGVGKTTAALNLAAAAGGRVLLVDADPLGTVPAALGLAPGTACELGGVSGQFVEDAVPGVDLFVPAGNAPDTVSARLSGLFEQEAVRAEYRLALVDAPTLRGANRGLLGCCHEAVVLTRPGPLAWRALPAVLEAVQDEQHNRPEFRFHGLVMTDANGTAEPVPAHLHEALTPHVLPVMIEHDDEVPQAALRGESVVRSRPEGKAARQYRELARELGLIEAAKTEPAPEARGGWLTWILLGILLGVIGGFAVSFWQANGWRWPAF